MKKIYFILIPIFIFSCNSDETLIENTNYNTIYNLHAPSETSFTKFDFDSGMETPSENEWDIAFKTTTIIVNGGSKFTDEEPERTGNAGAYIYNGILSDVEFVDDELMIQDSDQGYAIATGSGNGWYNYSGPPNHIITPIPGKVIILRTRDNKYAKIEILSYYLDAPDNPDYTINDSRYYTFNYVLQSEQGNTTFN